MGSDANLCRRDVTLDVERGVGGSHAGYQVRRAVVVGLLLPGLLMVQNSRFSVWDALGKLWDGVPSRNLQLN